MQSVSLNSLEIEKVHAATLRILEEVGVAFHSSLALEVFAKHGFRTDGKVVFFSAKQTEDAIATAPSQFTLFARNPGKNLHIGGGDIAFAPGYGAPFVVTGSSTRRSATLEDYANFCKLSHTSDIINVTGFLCVDPSDLLPESYHLDMLFDSMTLSDQPFMGSPLSGKAAQDAVEMAGLTFGRRNIPVMISIINALQPLQFSLEMTESLMIFARNNQPVIVMGGGNMGATAPLNLPGFLCTQNAAVLAGIVLAQLVNPGCPVIYGVGGSTMDMQSGAYNIGGPELCRAIRMGAAIAKHYGFPCRGGGALTDSHQVDFQAGAQSAFCIESSLITGMDVIIHGCGILSSYMAMSYDKFIADEELWRHAFYIRKSLDFSELDLEVDAIKEVGIGGQFITQDRTVRFCRTEPFRSPLMNRLPFEKWENLKYKNFQEKAWLLAQKRLEEHHQPAMEADILRELSNYVQKRKDEIGRSTKAPKSNNNA